MDCYRTSVPDPERVHSTDKEETDQHVLHITWKCFKGMLYALFRIDYIETIFISIIVLDLNCFLICLGDF